MFRNYFISSLRSLLKNRTFTFVNTFGLAFSLGICMVVLGHISHELSFEDIHHNKHRIHRLNATYRSGDTLVYTSMAMSPIGNTLRKSLPEIENAAVFRVMGDVDLQIEGHQFLNQDEYQRHGYEFEGNVFCANPDFLKVFSLPLVHGDPEYALNEPFTALISEEAAQLYFQDKSPIGKTVTINKNLTCTITGVLKDIPQTTQVYCQFILSYSSLNSIDSSLNSWTDLNKDYTYLLLRNDCDYKAIENKIPKVAANFLPSEVSDKYSFELQPLKDIYFSTYGSGRQGDLSPHGELSMIIEMGVIALFILLLAIANFINLSTARASDRFKEVGIRKVIGAQRSHLISQFISESILITFFSALISLVIYEAFVSIITPYLPRTMMVNFYENSIMVAMIVLLVLVVGIAAGFYPALFLSRHRPISILNHNRGMKSSKSLLRKGLVVFQFILTIILICTTLILYKQIEFASSAELGFDSSNILLIHYQGESDVSTGARLKQSLSTDPSVRSMSIINTPPGVMTYRFRGLYTDKSLRNRITTRAYYTDDDFFETFDIRLIEGGETPREMEDLPDNSIFISKSLARSLGDKGSVGEILYGSNEILQIVGIYDDFVESPISYFGSYGSFVQIEPELTEYLAIKFVGDRIDESIPGFKKIWADINPDVPFKHSLLNSDISEGYSGLRGEMRIFFTLSVLTIMMASLGIFGLIGYTAERKTKEIGIRKILGSSTRNIIFMLQKELAYLILIANFIAIPIAVYFSNEFIRYFTIKTEIGYEIYLLTSLSIVIVAYASSSYQAIKAARANPVDALRYE